MQVFAYPIAFFYFLHKVSERDTFFLCGKCLEIRRKHLTLL